MEHTKYVRTVGRIETLMLGIKWLNRALHILVCLQEPDEGAPAHEQ